MFHPYMAFEYDILQAFDILTTHDYTVKLQDICRALCHYGSNLM